MNPTDTQLVQIPVTLSDGTVIFAEAHRSDPEEDVAFTRHALQEFTEIVRTLTGDLMEPLRQVGGAAVDLEFHLGISIEAGKLTALILGAGADASVTITVHWGAS